MVKRLLVITLLASGLWLVTYGPAEAGPCGEVRNDSAGSTRSGSCGTTAVTGMLVLGGIAVVGATVTAAVGLSRGARAVQNALGLASGTPKAAAAPPPPAPKPPPPEAKPPPGAVQPKQPVPQEFDSQGVHSPYRMERDYVEEKVGDEVIAKLANASLAAAEGLPATASGTPRSPSQAQSAAPPTGTQQEYIGVPPTPHIAPPPPPAGIEALPLQAALVISTTVNYVMTYGPPIAQAIGNGIRVLPRVWQFWRGGMR